MTRHHHHLLLLLLLLSTTPSYALYPNANDPDHDHTASAKRLDADGEHDEDAAEAFRAAVRFNPTSIATSLNLAVALLRYGNLSQSRIAFENTFALAVQLKKPKNVFNRITRNFNTLQKEWEQVFNEQMDPVESSLDPHAFQLLMRHRKPDNLPLHMLSEKKYLDKETSDRGQQGLESRVPPGTQTPPTMVTLDNIHGMDTVLNYVGGDDFQTNYWEQWPLHIRATGAMNGLVSLQELLKDGPYGYGSEKTRAPHRNVNYIKREFGNKDTIARDTPQHAKDLLSAMRRNYTVQMLGTHYWMPAVANMSYWLSQTTSRPVSVNLYATPQNQQVSLVPHSDFQCALMVQLEGRKRWRLWKLPDIWLPVRYRHIRGRDDGDIVDKEWLGKPYMDVILEPGDVLYVPRGCLHLTSTVEEKKKTKRPRSLFEKKNNLLTPSIHLTVGMEAMWDHGVSATWEAFFGAGEFFRHDHAIESYYRALGNLIDKDIRFRETLPMDFLKVNEEKESTTQILGEGASEQFVQQVRERMHTLVDEMIDSTPLIKRIRRLMLLTKSNHNDQLKQVVKAAEVAGGRKRKGGGRVVDGDEL